MQVNLGTVMMDFGRCKEAWKVTFKSLPLPRADSWGKAESQETDVHKEFSNLYSWP